MVIDSGKIARFGGDCWPYAFDGGRVGGERSELFILFDGVIYIILMSCLKK